MGHVLPQDALNVVQGELPRGQSLLLIDEIMDPSGVVRARVAKESSPRGICVAPLGWVTAMRDGEAKLRGCRLRRGIASRCFSWLDSLSRRVRGRVRLTVRDGCIIYGPQPD